MGALLDWLVTAAGVAIVGTALRDIFHTLWHPSGHGDISRWLMAAVWRVGQAVHRRGSRGSLAGPVAMVVVVFSWATMIAVGGALVYAPHLPEGFGVDDPAATDGGFLDGLYLSLVTTGTLGFGDIVPTEGWLRVAVPVQALIGFGLLTAAVTWVLQLYPTLVRRRALAVRLATLRRIDTDAMLASPEGTLAVHVLGGLAEEFAQARVDLTEYAETYYFREGTADAALPAMVGDAVALARRAATSPCADVRLAGSWLSASLQDYAFVIDRQFLKHGGDARDVLRAYATDHGYEEEATAATRGGSAPPDPPRD